MPHWWTVRLLPVCHEPRRGTAPCMAAWAIMCAAATCAAAEMPDPARARSVLAPLERRVRDNELRKRRLAPYLRESVGIIERLIVAFEEDGAKGGEFHNREAEVQASECAMLLASLEEELDLEDLNRRLEAVARRKTVDVRALGARGDGTNDDGPAIREAIERASRLGQGARVLVPAGRYLFDSFHPGGGNTHLFLRDLRDLSLEGEADTVLVMRKIGPALRLQGCRNVAVRNIAIDYDPLPFTQGTIVAVDAEKSTFDMELERGYPDPTQPYFLKAVHLRGTVRHPRTGDIDRSTGDPRVAKITKLGGGRYRLTVANNRQQTVPGLTRRFRKGYRFVLNARATPGGAPAVIVTGSSHVTLDKVRVYASYSHTFLAPECDGLKMLGCVAEPLPGSGRLACNNADGFHCPNNRKGPLMEACRFRRVNDDCFNFYGRAHCLAHSKSPTAFTLDQRVGGAPGRPVSTSMFRKGDPVAFLNPNNARIDGFARVADVRSAAWNGRTCLEIRLDRAVEGLVTREVLGKRPFASREYVNRTAGRVEHFAVNLCVKADGFVIRNCEFGHNRAGGVKIQASNGVVTGTTIEETQGTAFIIAALLNWREGYSPHNIVVRDNRITNPVGIQTWFSLPVRNAPVDVRPMRRILIEGNTLARAPRPRLGAAAASYPGASAPGRGIQLRGVEKLVIRANRIESPRPVSLSNCAEVRVEGNTFVTSGKADPVRVDGKSDRKSITVTDNRTENPR